MTFDTIYKTYKYHLSLDIFCGAIHHKSLIIYTVAFVSKENTKVFVWVFHTFLEFMNAAPLTVIIDQDPTMKVALTIVFPNTFHHLCK